MERSAESSVAARLVARCAAATATGSFDRLPVVSASSASPTRGETAPLPPPPSSSPSSASSPSPTPDVVRRTRLVEPCVRRTGVRGASLLEPRIRGPFPGVEVAEPSTPNRTLPAVSPPPLPASSALASSLSSSSPSWSIARPKAAASAASISATSLNRSEGSPEPSWRNRSLVGDAMEFAVSPSSLRSAAAKAAGSVAGRASSPKILR